MLCLIKNKNIFSKFYKDVYTIKYQKRKLLSTHLLVFLYPTNQFFQTFQINEVIYTKLFILETDFTKKFTKILISIILYSPCKNINFYLLYMNNA